MLKLSKFQQKHIPSVGLNLEMQHTNMMVLHLIILFDWSLIYCET